MIELFDRENTVTIRRVEYAVGEHPSALAEFVTFVDMIGSRHQWAGASAPAVIGVKSAWTERTWTNETFVHVEVRGLEAYQHLIAEHFTVVAGA